MVDIVEEEFIYENNGVELKIDLPHCKDCDRLFALEKSLEHAIQIHTEENCKKFLIKRIQDD